MNRWTDMSKLRSIKHGAEVIIKIEKEKEEKNARSDFEDKTNKKRLANERKLQMKLVFFRISKSNTRNEGNRNENEIWI